MRAFVTGTDTGVGKTRVTATLAATMVRTAPVTIVKLVQTGVDATEPGDAHVAGALAGVPARELIRFREPADPWNAALAEGREAPSARTLATALDAFSGDLVLEGAGGVAVPLNARETLCDVAILARCEAIVVVGLRLGCINHAILTLEYLARRGVATRTIVFTEPWEPVGDAYRLQVERALVAKMPEIATIERPARPIPHLAHLSFEPDAARAIALAVGASILRP